MPFTTQAFAAKLKALRGHFAEDLDRISRGSGISVVRLTELESAAVTPTGDEVLILADYFKKDFRYFLDDDAEDASKQIDVLFREHSDELQSADRHAVAEFAHLCSSQALIEELLGRPRAQIKFEFHPRGKFYKQHGVDCAAALRRNLGLAQNAIVQDIFGCLRTIGIRVFRRRLENAAISGIFLQHPTAGPCVLVNYAEGLPRQRFSAAHELAHAILDGAQTSFSTVTHWSSGELVEIRANAFASNFLMPPELLRTVPTRDWADPGRLVDWARMLMVSVPALLTALKQAGLISQVQREAIRSMRLRYDEPDDPELGGSLTPAQRERKAALLRQGLSQQYVGLCFDAYSADLISRGRLAEALLVGIEDLRDVAALFGRSLHHG